MQSEEYEGNPVNSEDYPYSYSVISSAFSENDSNKKANKKTRCTRIIKKL
jgi:hypothetical protein